ncbi:MAG: hypothetical protein A2583_11265 [Bdellovibrionales bacterium RIFOXYD1_FULL_53_11]|nr:MAG: hypothetical protein A2583_11265 [Bdellovibrionales bacterium RIFOXYD1_FULL_53_11]
MGKKNGRIATMRNWWHGWYILVPSSLALICGVVMGLRLLAAGDDLEAAAMRSEAQNHSVALGEAVRGVIENIRAKSLLVQQAGRARVPAESIVPSLGEIAVWSEFEISGARVGASTHALTGTAMKLDPGTVALFAQAAAEQFRIEDIKDGGTTILRMKRDPQGAAEWLGFGFQGAGGKVVAAMVDPVTAFPLIAKTSSAAAGGSLRAYLLAQDGTVLSHSQGAYIGADFSGTGAFRDAIRPLFQGTGNNGSGFFRAIDQSDVAMSFIRPARVPLVVVVERIAGARFSGLLAQDSGVWMRLAAQIAAVAGMLVFFIVVATWRFGLRRRADAAADMQEEADMREDAGRPDMAVGLELSGYIAQLDRAKAEENILRNELMIAEEAVKRARQETDIVASFERDSALARDPRQVAKKMVDTVSRLCSSPAMFFAFHEGIRAAVLSTESGFDPGGSPGGAMSFPVDQTMLEATMHAVTRGECAYLSEYPPLAKLLLARTGVAHFEAWAVTGFGRLGRAAGIPRLLGILVVLRAGTESASRRESVIKMIRTAGLVYENTLLSQ